nr:uncharacterized protein LOC128685118 [Cherax quadricarinatus]
MGLGRIEWSIKNHGAEDDDSTSLMQHMNITWQRLSGHPLLALNNKQKNEAFSTDANSRPLTIVENPDPSSEQIYDIPKPPRPVEGPYSPVSSQEINAGEFLRERRSLLSDEASEQWKNDESTC